MSEWEVGGLAEDKKNREKIWSAISNPVGMG